MEENGQLHVSVALQPGKAPKGWLGPRVGLDVVEKRKKQT
jgi:hypothetical protein